MAGADNTAARVERTLTVRILRGLHPPGARLPTVRALALEFGINPATAQRAVARLERTGLVSTRQGSGTVVNDPETHGDLSLVPAWLEALDDEPERAAALLAELLEVRRILAARLLVQHRERLLEGAAELAAAASALLDARGIDAVRAADIAFARTLLRRTGNRAAVGVLNAAARLLEEVPAVAEAMYAEPARNTHAMQEVLALLAEPAPSPDRIEAKLAEIDRATVARYLAGATR
ncbi:MAG: GntR family transcriptional regulator [Planctomycetota bacterium]|jgi:DNA-binding FadR family transcriptional regulator|nr:GntR family transcriptional regulator [Planctomycetota bacterium]